MTSKVVIFAPYGNAYSKNLAKQFGTSNIIRKRFKTGKKCFLYRIFMRKIATPKTTIPSHKSIYQWKATRSKR